MGRVRKKGLIGPEQQWQSKDPRSLAKEIATFQGGVWPERTPRKIQISLDGAPTSDEELFKLTGLNPTLLSEMTQVTRHIWVEVFLEDIQDVYSEVMLTLVQPNFVTYDTLRKFKHLVISLSLNALAEVCQAAFDKTDFDDFPEVAPDERPGCMCPLDVAEFTKLTAASTALVKMIHDAEGELPPAAESRIITVKKKWHYEDV